MKIPRELHHSECIAKLPEYLNGALRHNDAAAVATHLEQCQRCREHLRLGHSLRRHFTQLQKTLATLQSGEREQINFERLWQRIEADPRQIDPAVMPPAQEAAGPRQRRAHRSHTRRPWRSFATIASSLVTALVAAHLAMQPSEQSASRHAWPIGNHLHSCQQLRVHFIDNLPQTDLQQLLGAIHARVVDGPGREGEYTLAARAPDKTLHQLQLHPAVVQAEATGC